MLAAGLLIAASWAILSWVAARSAADDLELLRPLTPWVARTALGGVLTAEVAAVVARRRARRGAASAPRTRLQSLLPVVMAIALATALTWVCLLALVFPLLLVVAGTFVLVPAARLEGGSPLRALTRSWRLTAGSRWALLGAWLLIAVIELLGLLLTGVAVRYAQGLSIVLMIGTLCVGDGLLALLRAVAFDELRAGKEYVDATAVARVFD